MSKVIVFELKRLVPLALLLVLLAGLSFYDYMTPETHETEVMTERETGEEAVKELEFATEDEGYRTEPAYFELVEDSDSWARLIEEKNLGLSKGALNEKTEMGLVAFHSKIEEIWLLEEKNTHQQVEVLVKPKNEFYHVVVIDKNKILDQDEIVNWRFVDEEGKALYQITLDP